MEAQHSDSSLIWKNIVDSWFSFEFMENYLWQFISYCQIDSSWQVPVMAFVIFVFYRGLKSGENGEK